MELISGFLLWMADILGLKWVMQERNGLRKAAKALIFLVVGIFFVLVILTLTYP